MTKTLTLLAAVALVVLGVILFLAVDGSLGGVDATVIGVILVMVGAIAALISVFASSSSPSGAEADDEDPFRTIPR